ncbi:MAG: 3-mercaptopyruvate sulfurtransferase [Pseudomonadota bacterium]|jgi:thiosulfate/3-mercaptopyruvate sulfurtransferase
MDLSSQHLVSVDWLARNLQAPDLMIFDGSWHLPSENRDARAEYAQGHIPGAFFFDIDDLSDDESPLPHMLPPPVKFASRLKRIGVGDGVGIVVYDSKGIYSSARVWWTFRALGHDNVAVLDGGLPAWKASGLPLTDQPPAPRPPRHFSPRVKPAMVRDLAAVKSMLASGSAQVADARPAARFAGDIPEPRPGLRSGHMPGSRNVPFDAVLNADGRMKPADDLRTIFAAAGIDFSKPVITSCGSGVTAAVLSLALAIAGHTETSLYDGSWAEWGQPESGGDVVAGFD